jgi:hypothetical protein
MNVIFSGYSRLLQVHIVENVNDNVLIAYNKSDVELSCFYEKYGNQFSNPKYINTDNDFTEMDTTHGESMVKLECILFDDINMPLSLKKMYYEVRSNWTLSYMSRNGRSTLKNSFCQHSGQPLTLCGNTLLNMSAVGAFIELGEILYIAFKGDDMNSRSTHCNLRKIAKETEASYYGYKFKVLNPIVSEFIANIITPHGFFPDVLRRVTKNISKVYESEEQWEESRINILESIKCVRNNTHYVTGLNLAVKHYNDNQIAVQRTEIEYIYAYLTQLSTMKFGELQQMNNVKKTLHYADVTTNKKYY